MAGKRHHSNVQDTPPDTPLTKFQLAVLELKKPLPRGYQPSPKKRLSLARELETAAKTLFVSAATAALSGCTASNVSNVLHDRLENTVQHAKDAWNRLVKHYRLAWAIRDPAKRRAYLRTATASERELPPVDSLDIGQRVRDALRPLADQLEYAFTKALTHTVTAVTHAGRLAEHDESDFDCPETEVADRRRARSSSQTSPARNALNEYLKRVLTIYPESRLRALFNQGKVTNVALQKHLAIDPSRFYKVLRGEISGSREASDLRKFFSGDDLPGATWSTGEKIDRKRSPRTDKLPL